MLSLHPFPAKTTLLRDTQGRWFDLRGQPTFRRLRHLYIPLPTNTSIFLYLLMLCHESRKRVNRHCVLVPSRSMYRSTIYIRQIFQSNNSTTSRILIFMVQDKFWAREDYTFIPIYYRNCLKILKLLFFC